MVERQLNLIEPTYYYDQIFLTNTLYKEYKSEALVFSSHIGYVGECIHKITFDKYDFIGRPKFWDKKECDISLTFSSQEFSERLVKLPFYSSMSNLYQRGKFIKLLLILRMLKVFWRSS